MGRCPHACTWVKQHCPVSLVGQDRNITPVPALHPQSLSTLDHHCRVSAFPGRRYPKDPLLIQDGMTLLHTFANLPPTCDDIWLQVLSQIVTKKHFLFVTDTIHSLSNFFKAQERLRCGSRKKNIRARQATRKPYDFKVFLANDDNTKQLCQLLQQIWGGQQAGENRDGCADCCKLVLLVLHKYHIIDQIDFTLSIISSPVTH